jgi:hypothetical protein
MNTKPLPADPKKCYCNDGFYTRNDMVYPNINKCDSCPANCNLCSYITGAVVCTQCAAGYSLADITGSGCVACATALEPNCLACEPLDPSAASYSFKCTSCVLGMTPRTEAGIFKCWQVCALPQVVNITTNVCKPCSNQFITDDTYCLGCNWDLNIANYSCTDCLPSFKKHDFAAAAPAIFKPICMCPMG